MQSERTNEIFGYFKELFGDSPRCELDYKSGLELLVAIILSAQCTDKRVNIVTGTLFKKYRTAEDFAGCDIKELEAIIRPTGFFRNKASNVQKMCRALIENYGGVIPKDTELLVTLPGVGRKTANVFVSEFYKIPAIGVDTHVQRVSRRLGFSDSKTPHGIELQLQKVFDKENWGSYHLYMVLFGRYVCKAVKPKCGGCEVRRFCGEVKRVLTDKPNKPVENL